MMNQFHIRGQTFLGATPHVLQSYFCCAEYGLRSLGGKVEKLTFSAENAQALSFPLIGPDYGTAKGRNWRDAEGSRRVVESLEVFAGEEGCKRILALKGAFTIVLSGRCDCDPHEHAAWVEDCAIPHARSYGLTLTVESHREYVQSPAGQKRLAQLRRRAGLAMLNVLGAMADIEDVDGALRVWQDQDRRILDLSWEKVEKLAETLWHTLSQELAQRKIDIEDAAFIPIPRAGLIVLGLLSYAGKVAKEQIIPFCTIRENRILGWGLPTGSGWALKAIVLVDDVAGLGHTLKRSLKLIRPLFPAAEILTAVLVDVARIRLADGVDPDAAAMTTDILNIRFPWGSPDFSRYLRKETKNV